MEIKKSLKILKPYNCDICDFHTSYKHILTNHFLTRKHNLNANGNNLEIEKSLNYTPFYCELCNYKSLLKKDFNKHCKTKKHINATNNVIIEKSNNCCNICNKRFSYSSGLWKHKKTCIPQEEEHENIKPTKITPELFMEVLNQSKELQNVLIEQNKELQSKLLQQNEEYHKQLLELTNKPSMVNSNNKNFNLQFFLNETCKDAMNIADFVNSLTLTIEDFEATGRLGYIDGISRIIINGLKGLTTEKLPLHCTDLKRETIYIKDNDVWEKENQDKQRVKWAIDNVATKNLQKYKDWKELYPDCEINNTPANHKSVEILLSALGGVGKQQEDKYREKIMKNVFKEVVLDKK